MKFGFFVLFCFVLVKVGKQLRYGESQDQKLRVRNMQGADVMATMEET